MDYETTQSISEIRKRLNRLEDRVLELEPKPKPNPTIPSLEKARPTPQERAQEREILQAQARKSEEKQREERLLEREKLGLHGIPPAKNPTSPRHKLQAPPVPKRTLEQRKADAAVGKFSIDDFNTAGDRAIQDHKR